MIGAKTSNNLEGRLALINRNNGCGRQCLKELHGKMAKATSTDDNNERTRNKQRKSLLDRVIGRKASIGERSSLCRRHIAERHEVASGRYKEVLGHTAVDAETGTAGRNVEAVVLHALAAVRTLAAAPCAVNGNGRTNLEPGSWHSAGTECFDPASVLVAEGHWCFARAACRELHEADIAVACAGAANANEHLARAGIGLSDLVECSGGVDLGRTADQLECLHGNPRRQSNV